jgi:hypothetical protein
MSFWRFFKRIRKFFCCHQNPKTYNKNTDIHPVIFKVPKPVTQCAQKPVYEKNNYHRIIFNPYAGFVRCYDHKKTPTTTSPAQTLHIITYIEHGWTFFHIKPFSPSIDFYYNIDLPEHFTFVRTNHVKKNIPYDILYDANKIPTLFMLSISTITQCEMYRFVSLKTVLPVAIYKLIPPIYFECLNCHDYHFPRYINTDKTIN